MPLIVKAAIVAGLGSLAVADSTTLSSSLAARRDVPYSSGTLPDFSDGDDSAMKTATTSHEPPVIETILADIFPTTPSSKVIPGILTLARPNSSKSSSFWGSTAVNSSASVGASAGAAGTATASPTPTGLGCYTYADPESGHDGISCQCPGYAGILPTLTGTASPCLYTTLPTTTSSEPTTTDPPEQYPYTFTDMYGVVLACESTSTMYIPGYSLTNCAGSRTTLHAVTRTVTETVTTSALSKFCMGGGYFECVHEMDGFSVASCPKMPRAQSRCEAAALENAQEECERLCTYTTTTYVTTSTTLAQ